MLELVPAGEGGGRSPQGKEVELIPAGEGGGQSRAVTGCTDGSSPSSAVDGTGGGSVPLDVWEPRATSGSGSEEVSFMWVSSHLVCVTVQMGCSDLPDVISCSPLLSCICR